jgi:uncharacterized membrane protein YcaP (DUF421 family)
MSWHDEIIGDVATLPVVASATVVICGMLVALFRVFGSRTMAPASPTDVACMVAVGAVAGRTVLLATPTLAEGVIALAMLFVLHRTFEALGRGTRLRKVLVRAPLILVSNGVLREEAMLRGRVSADVLRQRLRLAGVGSLRDVDLAVLEPHGQISVLRGVEPDTWIVGDLPSSSPENDPRD